MLRTWKWTCGTRKRINGRRCNPNLFHCETRPRPEEPGRIAAVAGRLGCRRASDQHRRPSCEVRLPCAGATNLAIEIPGADAKRFAHAASPQVQLGPSAWWRRIHRPVFASRGDRRVHRFNRHFMTFIGAPYGATPRSEGPQLRRKHGSHLRKVINEHDKEQFWLVPPIWSPQVQAVPCYFDETSGPEGSHGDETQER